MPRRRSKYDPAELAMGRAVEREHVDEPSFAEEIAMDHLDEHPHYYSRLAACDVEGGQAASCPTCKRNPRPLPPTGYGYAFAMGVCPVCRWWRVMSRHVDPRLFHCARCGHLGLMLVEDRSAEELEHDEDLVLRSIREPKENPRHKRWQPKSRRPPRDFACAKCGALAAPGSDLCRACTLEEAQPDRCPDCGRRRVFTSRDGWICPNGCTEY